MSDSVLEKLPSDTTFKTEEITLLAYSNTIQESQFTLLLLLSLGWCVDKLLGLLIKFKKNLLKLFCCSEPVSSNIIIPQLGIYHCLRSYVSSRLVAKIWWKFLLHLIVTNSYILRVILFWLAKVNYKISWKFHISKKGSISDKCAGKARKSKIYQNFAF